MTKEAEDLSIALKAIAAELWPYRPTEHLKFSDEILVLGIHLTRELRVKRFPPGYADGVVPQPSVRTRGKRESVE